MTSSQIGTFLERQPFEPFIMYMVDGREIRIAHPDFAAIGEYALGVWLIHPAGEIELIDVSLISSMRTTGPVDLSGFIK